MAADPLLPNVVPALSVVTVAVDPVPRLLPYTDASAPLAWVRGADTMVGLGVALRLEFAGPTALTDAAAAWRRIVAAASVEDAVASRGSGLVAFGTFPFAGTSTERAVLIVPETIVGRRQGRSWVTRISVDVAPPAPALPAFTELDAPLLTDLRPGRIDEQAYRAAVGAAIARIGAGELDKVVLARDLVGRVAAHADRRWLIRGLALDHPGCWTFAVDGLIGASPETLIRMQRGQVRARVLAGTVPRGADPDADARAVAALMASAKNRHEHALAVASLADRLGPLARSLSVPDAPTPLRLSNVWHLASDVVAEAGGDRNALDLVAAVHPTAAVAGTPREAALAAIAELEPVDRGRYAGPVGWIDAAGDGEWAIALRCARVAADGTVTAWAGAGIVAGSDPDAELAETGAKFAAVVDVLRTPQHIPAARIRAAPESAPAGTTGW